MPQLARFLALHAAIGFGLAACFVAVLLLGDPGGLGGLLRQPADYPVPLVLLWFFSGLTFGSAQIGIALWLAAED